MYDADITRPTILLVDDKYENLLALEGLLQNMDPQVTLLKAGSGNEALKICLDHELALVLMDVQMPEMDGYETIALLRKYNKTRLLPVILISAIYREEIWLKKGIESGAVDFIPKPIVPEILTGKVKIFLELYCNKKELEKSAAEMTTANQQLQQEISERRRVEEELRHSEERFRAIFEQAADAICLLDPANGRLIEFNNRAPENLGYTRTEFKELKITDFQIAASPELEIENIRRIIQEGQAVFETRHRTKEGKFRHIHVRSKLISIHNTAYVLNIWRDITDLKRMEADLRRSNTDLEQFAYAASHDLREPLRAIINYISLIEAQYLVGVNPKALDFFTRISDAARRLQAMIENLLDYSRINRINNPFQFIEGEEVLNDALCNLKVPIEEKQAIISHDPMPGLVADRAQLSRVFQNLLSNALKFCEKTPPRIHITTESDNVYWQFKISDNGIGIEPEFHEHIFELFQRVHSRRKYDGTGMGLAIVQKIIQRHRGQLWIESKPGKGTSVFFTLPRQQENYG